ncbi:MAG TPA: acyltransferase family protein, partial [Pirellulaceae bacterium]|nr:acyltransferase family protein [Pirellulaceae bacterium]
TWLVDASTDSGWLFCYGTNLVISARRQWCFGPLDHFWSLAVEEQFYLLWPFVILWLRRRQAMLLCASLIVGASLGRFVWILEGGDEVTRYALTVFRMDTLAAGAWIALYLRGGASVASCGRIATVALCTISLLLLPLSVLHLRLLSLTDVLWTAGCAALLVAMLAAQPGTILDHVGKSRVLGWFGHYSYGLYVFGNLLIAALAPLITAAEMGRLFGNNYVGQVVYVAVVGAATVAVAVLSWHLYEKHFLGLKALLANAAKRRPGIG